MEKIELVAETKKLLARNIMQKCQYTYINQRKYFLHPEVFNPVVFSSSVWYAEQIPIQEGDNFLEIGTGTGLIAIESSYRGTASVIATDISKDAVILARQNAQQHDKNIQIIQSDLFDGLEIHSLPTAKFDIIFWAMPLGYTEEEPKTFLEKTTFDFKYQNIDRYFAEAERYISPTGKLLFAFSKIYGSEEKLDELLNKYHYRKELLAEIILQEIRPVDFGLYQAVKYSL